MVYSLFFESVLLTGFLFLELQYMRRNRSDPLLFDPEPERTLHLRQAQQRLAQQLAAMEGNGGAAAAEMERRIEARVQERLAQRLLAQEQADANRSLRDLTEASMSYNSPGSIVFPRLEGVNFEIRPQFIQLVSQHQFGGSSLEDPHAHLERFIRNCNTFRTAIIDPNIIRLTLFPFSIRDAAEEWLNSQPLESISTWDDLAEKFTTKFIPKALIRKMRNDINTFTQSETENLHEAWERFKRMLRKCPQHNLSLADQVSKFYDGLLYSAKSNLDAAANGEFDALQPQTGQELIEKMAARAANTVSDRHGGKKVFEVDAVDQIIASNRQIAKQMFEMQKQFEEVKLMQLKSGPDCVTCGGANCGEHCKATSNQEEVNYMGQAPFSNNYNPGWRNHPNLSWGEQGGNFQKQYPNQRFQGQNSGQPQKKSLEEIVEEFIIKSENNYKNQGAAIKNLENQFSQLAKQSAERHPGTLPSDTIINPRKENASAITTRSRKVLHHVEKEDNEVVVEKKIELKKNEDEGEKSEKRIPFPNAIMKKNLEKQFSKFVSMFKKLHVDIPFSEVLEKMPQYAKFMKEILSKKRRLSEMDETIMMTEECSAIIQRKLTVKVKDPGRFTLPVEFEGQRDSSGLIDLGASVNLMPRSMFERLEIGELKKTMIQLQMDDRSIVYPWGVCEDVLVKVGKFVFPADFVILDMDEDTDIPLIFGRPFLATAKVKIDVEKGKVSVKAHGKKIKFKMFEQKPVEKRDPFLLDMMKVWSNESLENFFQKEGIAFGKKPAKKGLPSLKSLFKKEEVTSKPSFCNRLFHGAGIRNSFFDKIGRAHV